MGPIVSIAPYVGSTEWKPSIYTSVVPDANGSALLLHNSFMGAIARVPPEHVDLLRRYMSLGFSSHESTAGLALELREQGFFVRADVDEQTAVRRIMEKERENGYHLILLPHEGCNFRCVYCYETFARGKMEPWVVEGLKAFVAEKCKSISHLIVTWFGGEPLLARDLILDLSDQFISACRSNGVGYGSNITTNGWFLIPDVVDRLLERDVREYQVTLDGTAETHDRTRHLAGGGATHSRILSNLLGMSSRKDDFAVKIRVNFGNTTLGVVEKFLEETAPLYRSDNRFTVFFHPVERWGGPHDSELDVCDTATIGSVRRYLTGIAIECGAAPAPAIEPLLPHGTVCHASRENTLIVGADGTIYKCTVASLEDERNRVGRLSSNGEPLLNIDRWRKWTKLEHVNTEKCASCGFYPACQGRSCPLIAMDEGAPSCPMSAAGYADWVRLAAVSSRNGSERGSNHAIGP